MIQRIQTIYLIVAFIAMCVCAFFLMDIVLLGGIASLISTFPVYATSLYKKRPLQSTVCKSICIVELAFAIVVLVSFRDAYSQSDLIGAAAACGVSIVFTLLANKAIMKDEKLVRSLDRIR